MSRGKKHPEAPPPQDPPTALMAALGALTNQLETLTREVGTLTERTQVLTEAIDDVRSELEWAIRHLHYPPPRLISGTSQDRTQDAEVEHGSVTEEQLLPEETGGRSPAEQRELW